MLPMFLTLHVVHGFPLLLGKDANHSECGTLAILDNKQPHATNTMGMVREDFEKGEADGARDASATRPKKRVKYAGSP